MKDKIYKSSPLFVKSMMLNVKAFLNKKQRYSDKFEFYLEEYNNLLNAERDFILEYQKQELIKLLTECGLYVPYYKEVFKSLKINTIDIEANPYAVLSRLPLLNKRTRKEQVEQLINQNENRKTVEIGFTSGTSGTPTVNYLDKESIERSFALWHRFYKIMGFSNRDFRKVRFSGRLIVKPTRDKAPFWIYSLIDNQLFMSSYHLKDENIEAYITKLQKFKPELIDGYPSAIYIIARYINKKNISLGFKPLAISTTAETLYDFQRTEMEKAFGCKVFNQYASSEGVPPIMECREGKLHIHEDTGVFEFLNDENLPAKPGEIARIVVTSFRNLKTPLLRYEIQDSVILPLVQESCKCGCKMFYVESIVGREDDILWTKEKGYVGRMDTAYKGLNGIEKSQIIQVSPDKLIVNQVVDSSYNENENQKMIMNLKERLGENINIEVNLLDDIPNGANGKFNAVVRKFKIEL